MCTDPPPLRENRRRGPLFDVCVKLNLSMNRSTQRFCNEGYIFILLITKRQIYFNWPLYLKLETKLLLFY